MKPDPRRLALLLLIALLLPMVSQAAQHVTIQALQEQAATRWQQSYPAHGRDILVDVRAQLPDVKVLPMLEMCYQPLAIHLPSEPGWYIHPNAQRGMAQWPGYFAFTKGPEEDEGPTGWATIDGKRVSARPHKQRYEGFEQEEAYLPGNPLTFAHISAIVEKTLQDIGLDPAIIHVSQPFSLLTHAYYGNSAEEYLSPGWGAFSWHPLAQGVPIHHFGLGAAFDFHNSSPGAHLSFSIRTPDSLSIGGTLLTQHQVLADDLPLAPFDQVIKALEAEIAAGRLRHVFELKLCYAMAYPPGLSRTAYHQHPDTPAYTVPVWVADVLWVASPRKAVDLPWEEPDPEYYGETDPRNSLSYRLLMVNAQTGKLYDPLSKDRNRGFYEGYLSWQDVGGLPAPTERPGP